MKKVFFGLLLLLICVQMVTFAQSSRKLSLYLSGHYRETLYDRTILNNPWAVGLGTQLLLNNKTKFKPVVDVSADAFLISMKIQYLGPNDEPLEGIEGMVNLYAGASYHPVNKLYISFVGGPSFINGNTHLGIKPSLGYYFSKTQKLTATISYINVFNRIETRLDKHDFRAISVAFGIKIF